MCVPRDQERSEWRHGSHDRVETGKFVDIIILRDLMRSHNHPALKIFQSVRVVGDLARPQEKL
jgi:hypothetical protein